MKDESLLDYFRNASRCEAPDCPRRLGRQYPLQPHHIFPRGGGRIDVRFNIVAIDPLCHTYYQEAGESGRQKLLVVVANREWCHVDDIKRAIDFLRSMPKNSALTITRARNWGLSKSAAYLAVKAWREWKERTGK